MKRAAAVCLLALIACRASSGPDAAPGSSTQKPTGVGSAGASSASARPPERALLAAAPTSSFAAPLVLDPSVYRDGGAAPALPAAREATSPPQDRAPRPKRVCVVAAIGDSLTDPAAHGGGYLAYLRRQAPGSRFDSYGKGGEMVNQMRRRFARDVLGEPPAAGKPRYTDVIVFGGVNDLYSDLTAGRTVEKISADLALMYGSAREKGLRVIAVTVAPWGGFSRYYTEHRGETTRALNGWIAAQPGQGTVDVAVDSYAILSCGRAERLCPEFERPFRDGLHFGKGGHERLGKALHEQALSDCR